MPHCVDNRLTDGSKVVSPNIIVCILLIFYIHGTGSSQLDALSMELNMMFFCQSNVSR
jgi:hypothetical protein